MKINKTLSILAMTASFAAFANTATAAEGGECGEISITEMNWASSAVITYISKFILENGYGCTVETVPSATVPSLTSVAETGKPDIVTELWRHGAVILDELVAEGKVIDANDVFSEGGVEGWWVPAYLVEEHPELATIEGVLANPELVGGMFNGCPEGWGCRISGDSYYKAFGLEEAGIEKFDHGSGETLAGSLAAAYENKEPWFGYYWGPTSILGKYQMVLVDVGPADEEIHACASNADCEELGKSAYPPSPVATVMTTEFQASHPREFDLMSKVEFDNATLSSLLAHMDAEGLDYEQTAAYFLTTYPEIWSEWLDDEAKEKLASLM